MLIALLLGSVAFLAAQASDGRPASVEPLVLAENSNISCDPTRPLALFRPDGTELADLASIRMNSNTFIRAQLCVPTLIRVSAEGTQVDGVGARLAIHLGDTPLFDGDITGTIELELTAPDPGWLVIAFTNDLYRPPLDRNLWLRDLELIPLEAARRQVLGDLLATTYRPLRLAANL